MGLYGIKEPHAVSEQEILSYANKHGFGSLDIYRLRPKYEKYLDDKFPDTSINPSGSVCATGMKKRLIQPIQYMLFDRWGKLMVHTVNCNAGGFPNLNWNTGGAFEIFPPQSLDVVDSTFSIDELYPFFDPIEITRRRLGEAEYECVIFWNKFMGRQSRRLIEYAIENAKGHDVRFYLVNNDDLYIGKL